jgi:hypothetical protein
MESGSDNTNRKGAGSVWVRSSEGRAFLGEDNIQQLMYDVWGKWGCDTLDLAASWRPAGVGWLGRASDSGWSN